MQRVRVPVYTPSPTIPGICDLVHVFSVFPDTNYPQTRALPASQLFRSELWERETWPLSSVPSGEKHPFLTPSARITVSLDWASSPVLSTQLRPWQAQLWEEATLIFVSTRDLTEKSETKHPGVKGSPPHNQGSEDRLTAATRRRIAASYPGRCVILEFWMEASLCAPGLPGLGWRGSRGRTREDNILGGIQTPQATQEAQSPSWVWECLTHGGPAASLHLRMLRELLETRL